MASISAHDNTRPLTIVFIHGRDFKPGKDELYELWVNALGCGLRRDHPALLPAFDAATKVFAYYGRATADLLSAAGKSYDESLDIADRRNALAGLSALEQKKRKGIDEIAPDDPVKTKISRLRDSLLAQNEPVPRNCDRRQERQID